MNLLDFHWEVIHSLHRIKECSEHIVQPFCQAHGVTPMQMRILITLHQRGAQSVSELGRNTCMAGTNTSALGKKLDKDGLVTRSRSPDDERLVIISLTPEGETLVQSFMAEYALKYNAMLADATEEDKRIILQGMQCLTKVLDKNNKENPL